MAECTPGIRENQMQSSVDPAVAERLAREIADLDLGMDLEQSARASGALQRHRGIRSARDLLRGVLGYSVLDYSLRLLGAWASLGEVANLSKTAWRKRLAGCRPWLGHLVVLLLAQAQLSLPSGPRVRVKLVDATVITHPGSQGADWRLHLGMDLGRASLEQVTLTDGQGAEGLDRFGFQPGEILIADRAYALARHLGQALAARIQVIVRTGWNRLRLEQADGQPWDLVAWLQGQVWTENGALHEETVWISPPQGRFPVRLLAQALPAPAGEHARRRAHREAHKNHHTPDARSLYTAGFLLILTNLSPTWTAPTIVALYRFRWQVELLFKRYKSLLHLDHLRAHDPELAQVYLLGKLIGILLLERLQGTLWREAPEAFSNLERPLSPWRLTHLLNDWLQEQVRGQLQLRQVFAQFPALVRYLCDEPRTRVQQLARARALLARLGA